MVNGARSNKLNVLHWLSHWIDWVEWKYWRNYVLDRGKNHQYWGNIAYFTSVYWKSRLFQNEILILTKRFHPTLGIVLCTDDRSRQDQDLSLRFVEAQDPIFCNYLFQNRFFKFTDVIWFSWMSERQNYFLHQVTHLISGDTRSKSKSESQDAQQLV